MKIEDKYDERYKTKNTPWDIGKPDFNLVEVVKQTPVQKCKALDIGCGTGDNSIWLSQNGFKVCGTDTSEIALEKARDKALQENAPCRFLNLNFFDRKVEGAPFGFVFDRGCFHSFNSEEDRNTFARNVAAHLEESGLWLTIVGNADEQREIPGPPQRSAKEIVLAVEACFEVLLLATSHFGSNSQRPPRAWRCLLRKRRSN
jgi:2-polyprenyl-3-methyl-5-hydroxy-6-metoxy-1,4-benzoquinol methylase